MQVSPQAVSKWENAKCLPETAILPSLAEALHCRILRHQKIS
ncbi:MAG: helix-turn-helix transcriptional regulator [Lachnospiraceae bacterium]|nr:helix-turn-helix transcriptional regulator [Lachnospiraceae bacterium]MDE7205261.1 helix-turn-helix transcriptional regulator [Lachnospiraceae bacterium]